MNNLMERMKRIAVIGLTAVMIIAQVPQTAFGAEAETSTEPVLTDEVSVEAIAEETVSGTVTGEEVVFDTAVGEEAVSGTVTEEETLSDDAVGEETLSGDALWIDAEVPEEAVAGDTSSGAWTETNSLPIDPGSYILDTDVTLADTWVVSQNIILDLNGHKIELSSHNGSVIKIRNGAGLTIQDSSPDSKGVITGGNVSHLDNSDLGGGVYIDNGTFTMENGNITGNTARQKGGGVYVAENGTLSMNGGSISGNNAAQGGGVYVDKGTFTMENGSISGNKGSTDGTGVYVYNGKFTMKGGSITGNKAISQGGGGGGVYIDKGTFTMENGSITGNTADGVGGGVYVNNGTFTMEGGSIIRNTASGRYTGGGGVYVNKGTVTMNGGSIIRNTANAGGGVYVNNGTFTMNGGSFTGNTANSDGGGVYFAGGGTLSMNGGSITGNTADVGGGVEVSGSRFTMSGNAVLEENIAKFQGGGVRVTGSDSIFIIEGGSITRNTASSKGGGVYAGCKTFTMEGGSITGNTANAGGGVYVFSSGTFTMGGGSISGNKAQNGNGGGVYVGNYRKLSIKDGSISGNTAKHGGGVYVSESDSVFTMEGGSITGNTASGSDEEEGRGGGVYVDNPATFNMSGGTIKGNSAGKAGGVYISSKVKKISVSGPAVISGNTLIDNTVGNMYLDSDTNDALYIGITGEFTGSIGLLCRKTLEAAKERTISTVAEGKESYPLSEDITKHFFSDDPDYYVLYDPRDQKVKFDTNLVYPYEIEVPDLVYTGEDQAVTVSGNGKILDPGDYTVKYSPKTPHDAGIYTADISSKKIIGEKAEGVSFNVLKADIPAESITPPTEKTGLSYNGSALALVSGGSVSGRIGTMYYALTDSEAAQAPEFDGDSQSADKKWSTSVPTAINAGTYAVWYMVRGDENHNHTSAEKVTAEIAKTDFKKRSLSVNMKYGTTGMIELKEYIPEGGKPGNISISDSDKILSGTPSISEKVLSCTLTDDREKVGRTAKLTIPVTSQNYKDYELSVTITVTDCSHTKTELRHVKTANCMEKGYTGDLCCTECNAVIKTGEETPIDPDNHDFDYTDKSDITKAPTYLSYGEHTYHCKRNHEHTVTVADIPNLPSEDGRNYDDFAKDTKGLSGNAAVSRNEAADPVTGEVTEVISVGGEPVSKIITDPESGKETVESVVWIGGLKDSYRYTGSAIKPSIHVYDGTRKLKENTDYTVKWSKNKEVGTAEITVKFKGNYKDTKSETAKFEIKPAILGEDIIARETGVAVKKSAQKPVPVLTWKETGKTVPAKNFDVVYSPSEVKAAGTYTATITSKNTNFDGTATALVKVAAKDKVLSNVKVKFDPKSYNYTGKPIEPKYSLTMGSTTLTKDKDYRQVSLTGNTNPGTATIIFEAISGNAAGYVGSKTATFKISGKKSFKDAAIDITCAESVPYAKGGAKAVVIVTDKDTNTTLKEGVDYTLSYSKNKAVGTGAEVKVKGKGNYKDTVIKTFEITKQSLKAEGIGIVAADQFTTKSKLKAPVVTITDIDGKKLKANTDYTVGDPDLSEKGNTEDNGIVYITIMGKGNYSDTESVKVSFHYMKTVSSNIGKAKAKTIKPQLYTGSAVKLSKADLTDIVYTGSKGFENYLKPGTDFVVVSSGYSNNVKKGTAKVTIRGIGAYAGTKTLSFKIEQRQVDYNGALVGGGWVK